LLLVALSGCLGDVTGPRPRPPDPWILSSRGVRIFGETRIPVILVKFANGPVSPYSPAQLKERYVGGTTGGPLNAPFRAASAGRFRLRLDFSPWIASAHNSTGANEQFVKDAIAAADASMDFSKYDNDGPDLVPNSGDDDGFVDGGIAILHSSLDLACSIGGPTPTSGPHPHARTPWTFGTPPDTYRTNDLAHDGAMIGIQGYTIMSATECSGAKTNAPVLAHELGHLLFGLPDLYHPLSGIIVPATELWRARRWVVGCWDLMGAGSWGCGAGPPPRPPEITSTFGAWSRMRIGWNTSVTASEVADTTYELNAVSQVREGTILHIPIADGEYLLVEYRDAGSGDVGIPGAGVLIYHITESIPFRPTLATDPKLYRVALVEADDDSALVELDSEGGNRGVLADAFGGAVTTFSPATHSAARKSNGEPLPFRIEQISFSLATRKASVRLVREP
jgi:M6 family metalloprotease-like protein